MIGTAPEESSPVGTSSATRQRLGTPTLSQHWIPDRVLAGFMDRPHMEQVVGEWLNTRTDTRRARFWQEWDAAQEVVRGMPGVDNWSVFEHGPTETIARKHAELLSREDVTKSFTGANTSVRWVDLRRVIAIQPNVQTVPEAVPSDEDALIDYCLPVPRSTPCEVNVSFAPPIGQVMFLGDVPYMNSMNMDARDGKLTVSPALHVNFLQVVDFQGKSFLMNGYHRAYSLLQAGRNVVPAWVVENRPPVLAGPGFFNVGYLMGRSRPPLLQDFFGPASISSEQRQRRYGMLMRFEIAPFNVPL